MPHSPLQAHVVGEVGDDVYRDCEVEEEQVYKQTIQTAKTAAVGGQSKSQDSSSCMDAKKGNEGQNSGAQCRHGP